MLLPAPFFSPNEAGADSFSKDFYYGNDHLQPKHLYPVRPVDTEADLPGDTSLRPIFQEGRKCAVLGLHESRLQLCPGFWEVAVTRDADR